MKINTIKDLHDSNFSLKNRDNEGLLRILFPDYSHQEKFVSPFIQAEKIILFYPDKNFSMPEGKKVIRIVRNSMIHIDNRETYLSILELLYKPNLSPKLYQTLMDLEDDQFWNVAKMLKYTNKISQDVLSNSSSTFVLFKDLFSPFSESYSIYKNIGNHHQVIASALVTMFCKTTLPLENQGGISPGYKKAILNNKKYLRNFRLGILEYMESEKKEIHFMRFLWAMSKVKSGGR